MINCIKYNYPKLITSVCSATILLISLNSAQLTASPVTTSTGGTMEEGSLPSSVGSEIDNRLNERLGINWNQIKSAAAAYFNFPNQVIPENRNFTVVYYRSPSDIDQYIAAFMKRQNQGTADTQRAGNELFDGYRNNTSSLSPAFADIDGTIRVLVDHPDFFKNGVIDTDFFRSVLVHEAMHILSYNRAGLQQYSLEGGSYNWDEAVTDYFGEQISKIVFGEDFHYRTNYYTGQKNWGHTLRGQIGRVFKNEINSIKNAYINNPDAFDEWLNGQIHGQEEVTRRTYANRTLTSIEDQTAEAVKKYTERFIPGLRLPAKLRKINESLENHQLPKLVEKDIDSLSFVVFGDSTVEDFKSIFTLIHPSSSASDPVPNVYKTTEVSPFQ